MMESLGLKISKFQIMKVNKFDCLIHNSEVGKVREFSVFSFVLIFIKQNRMKIGNRMLW